MRARGIQGGAKVTGWERSRLGAGVFTARRVLGRGERGIVVLDDAGKHADPLEKRVERSVLAESPSR